MMHYLYLYPSYFVAVFGWIIISSKTNLIQKDYSENGKEFLFKKPWLEFIYVFIAIIITLLIGQLYVNNLLFKSAEKFVFLTESLNQLIIFSPFILLLFIRKQPFQTALLPKKGKLKSIILGLFLAIIAIAIYSIISKEKSIIEGVLFVYQPDHLDELVQVFLEDFAISILLFRLIAWIGINKAVVIVAILFAAGHIPAMISNGVTIENFLGLLLDALLGILILKTVYKSRNFLWFWMIHFAMDMTQYFN